MRLYHIATFLLVSLVASPIAHAAIVVQYDTVASTTSATIAATSADSSVSADLLAAGSGLTANAGSTYNWRGFDTANDSFTAAVGAGDFFTWGFDVSSGMIDLTDLDMRWDRSGSGPDDLELQVSVNGGTGISLLTHDYGDSGSGVDFTGVDLTSVPTLNSGDSVVFTLAAFNSESSGGTFDLETVDFGGTDPRSLRVNGTITAIPEPGSVAFLAIGMAGIYGVRRRRR